MPNINELLKKYNLKEVLFKSLWELTAWDKKFNADNRIATSLDTNVLDNKFLYYILMNDLKEVVL